MKNVAKAAKAIVARKAAPKVAAKPAKTVKAPTVSAMHRLREICIAAHLKGEKAPKVAEIIAQLRAENFPVKPGREAPLSEMGASSLRSDCMAVLEMHTEALKAARKRG